jgi:hypothetical protein
MRAWRSSVCALALAAAGCAAPTSPTTAPTMTPTITPTAPLVLAGQSNAVNVAPYLRAVYPLSVLSDSTQNGRSIASWSPTETPPVLWPILAADLRQPVQAFVWWQGESDRGSPTYLADDAALIARVRSENGNPELLVVLVRILDMPQNAGIRATQERVVAADPHAVLVSSDGPAFQDGATDHLTPAGYQAVAQRIIAALR